MDKNLYKVLQGKPYYKEGLAVILLVIAVTLLFLPAMIGWRGIFHDDQGMEEFPRYYFLARNFQRGIIPLWDPQTWCGAIPFYGRYYSNTYYLPLWPFFFFANLNNLDNAYWFFVLLPLWLHYVLGAVGMFILLRQVAKCGYIPSCFGALAYIYSPAFSYAYVWQQVVTVQAWLPWLLAVYVSLIQRWRFWKLVVGGIILAFIITGAAPSLWPFVVFLWGGMIILLMIFRLHQKKKLSCICLPLFGALVILLLAVGLSSVYLFSFFDGIQHTEEHIKLTAEYALREPVGSLPPVFLATLFIPNLFGNITGGNIPFLNPMHKMIYWEANLSGGMAISLLVMLGVVLAFKVSSVGPFGKRRRWFTIAASCLFIFAILCVLGRHLPFYRYVIGYLPGVGQLPRPIRYRLLQCFAVALLTGVGLDNFNRINSLYLQTKHYLRAWVWFYIISSFLVVALAMAWPFNSRDKISYEWFGKPTFKMEGTFFPEEVEDYFYPGKSVGNYSSSETTKKLGLFFDGESRGEIRYANRHQEVSPAEGNLAASYYAPAKGWYEFDVNIPAKKFVWIYQKTGRARIGYRGFRQEPYRGFTYDDKNKVWNGYVDTQAICFYREVYRKANSMMDKLRTQDIHRKPITLSIFYWLIAAGLLVSAVYYLSPVRFGYLVGTIAMLEFFCFGTLAFYGGTYSYNNPAPNHIRAVGPTHPILQRVTGPLTTVIGESTLRIATTQPFHDNFARLRSHFALMGYEMHPLERRFKRAIESAYGQPMHFPIYYQEPRPRPHCRAFLNHFSVGYLMSISPNTKFPHGRTLSLPGESKFFVHTNPDALPRAFTMDRVVVASEEEQLTQLISGDLRQAVYVSSSEGIPVREFDIDNQDDAAIHFAALQQENRIIRLNMDNPNRIEVDIEMSNPAMLVLTEVWYPGWEAIIDGRTTSVYRLNYCQRGVWLGKGRHHICFCFRPLAWKKGLIVSLGTVVVLLMLIGGVLVKKRYVYAAP